MNSIYSKIAEIEKMGDAAALCTIIEAKGSAPRHVGSKMIVFPDSSIQGSVGGGLMEGKVIEEAISSLTDGKSRIIEYNLVDPGKGDVGICGGHVTVYVEPIMQKPTIVIIGAGHVGKAVAHLAHWLGFRVVVNDDRPEFCTPEINPDADVYLPSKMEELPKLMNIHSQTYLVLTTRERTLMYQVCLPCWIPPRRILVSLGPNVDGSLPKKR